MWLRTKYCRILSPPQKNADAEHLYILVNSIRTRRTRVSDRIKPTQYTRVIMIGSSQTEYQMRAFCLGYRTVPNDFVSKIYQIKINFCLFVSFLFLMSFQKYWLLRLFILLIYLFVNFCVDWYVTSFYNSFQEIFTF